jgi:hypothetical protein
MDIVNKILQQISDESLRLQNPTSVILDYEVQARKLKREAYVAKAISNWPRYWRAIYYIGKGSLDRKFAAHIERNEAKRARMIYVIFKGQKALLRQTQRLRVNDTKDMSKAKMLKVKNGLSLGGPRGNVGEDVNLNSNSIFQPQQLGVQSENQQINAAQTNDTQLQENPNRLTDQQRDRITPIALDAPLNHICPQVPQSTSELLQTTQSDFDDLWEIYAVPSTSDDLW